MNRRHNPHLRHQLHELRQPSIIPGIIACVVIGGLFGAIATALIIAL